MTCQIWQKRKWIQAKTGNSALYLVGLHPMGVGRTARTLLRDIGCATSLPNCLLSFCLRTTKILRAKGRVNGRVQFLDIVITAVAMSGSGHRAVYQPGLCMDVLFRELFPMVVGRRHESCTSGT